MRGILKTGLFLLLLSVGISGLATGNVKGEEETTTAEFDYSKMPKEYRYTKDGWESYYDIDFCSNVYVSDQKFNGKESTPYVKVLVHNANNGKIGTVLSKNYYKVTYKNNNKPGKATAIIEGINGFYGKKEVKFKIKMPNVKIKSVTSKGRKITVKVIKSNIKGINYEIRYKKNTKKISKKVRKDNSTNYIIKGKWKTKTFKSTKFSTKKLKKGNYFVQVRSYVVVDNKKCSSKWKACDCLINVKTKKANKKNKKWKDYNAKSPNKFNKILKRKSYGKGNYVWNANTVKRIKYENVTYYNWAIYYNGVCKYTVDCDKKGNVIY